MKRQQAEAVLNRFLEECGDNVPAQSDIEPVLDRVWERLEWKADEVVGVRVLAVPARPFRFAWGVGMVLVAVLVNALIWRQGPPASVAVNTPNADNHSLSRSSAEQAAETLQVTTPQDVFELASVKLLAPSSDLVKTANQFAVLQSVLTGCDAGYIGPTRLDAGRLTIPAITVFSLVMIAYGKECTLVEGGPGWARSGDYYEIQALLPPGTPTYSQQDLQKGKAPRLQSMLQNLLADRFRLVMKREVREMSVYALTVASPGKMKLLPDEKRPAPAGFPLMPGFPAPQIGRGQTLQLIQRSGEAQLASHAISMSDLAKELRSHAGRIVVDKTGLDGVFDVDLKFVRDTVPSTAGIPAAPPQSIPTLPVAPAQETPMPGSPLRNALEDQLGLKLESARMPIEVLIIESVERPSEN
jgi:uncharacterized protein (TIGR03435 family)